MVHFDEEMETASSATQVDDLPDALIYCILSHLNNARDIAACSCVSKRWKEFTPFNRRLFFSRNVFDNCRANSDSVISNMIASTVCLEELIIYCPFSPTSLGRWLSMKSGSLRHLELRMDNLTEKGVVEESSSKVDSVGAATNVESLRLWGVLIATPPNWGVFQKLKSLEIVGARLKDGALIDTLAACPNLTKLSLLGCDGLRSVSIQLPQLEECRLDFYGHGDCILNLSCPKVHLLEIHGCSWIRVSSTHCLRTLFIANNAGNVARVDFGKLPELEFLSIRGVQWSWTAISSLLQCASEVKHLVMKIEFSGDSDRLQPFPEIDLVDFFNNHPKLHKFEMHGAMFAALCQRNSLRNIDSRFIIPCLEEVLITVRSPLNAEQKMTTLESIIKHSSKLRRMVIRVSQMKNTHSSADEFFEEVFRFTYLNPGIVLIE